MLRMLVAALLLAPALASAATIDTRPEDTFLNFSKANGRDVVGGTFVSSGTQLDSFTLSVTAPSGALDPVLSFRAVVMEGVSTGAAGTLLWESALSTVPTDDTTVEFSFAPSLAIAFGATYFIGLDNGLLTSVPDDSAGTAVRLGYRLDDVIPGRDFFRFNGEATFGSFSSVRDIASEIVMSGGPTTPVPLPASGLLLVAGLAGLGALRARRART